MGGHSSKPDLPVVNDAAAWAGRLAAKRTGREGYFAFYSSVAGAITTEAALMTIPIDGSDPTVMYTLTGLWFVFFGIAFFVHKDPSSGAKMY